MILIFSLKRRKNAIDKNRQVYISGTVKKGGMKMLRKIIKIDEEKCNGCGACAEACHEGAIAMVDGKAKLMREDYCDGLGDCLPACPADAISFEEREAAQYDEAAVIRAKAEKAAAKVRSDMSHMTGGCPGSMAKAITREDSSESRTQSGTDAHSPAQSRLSQWPVQIKLAPVNAPYFDGADLLVAADCTAYAFGGFHERFIKDRITLIGCPKLDDIDYSEKLTQIISENDIKSLTIVRMEVPCCGGIEFAAKKALQDSGRSIPWQVVTISTDGQILD